MPSPAQVAFKPINKPTVGTNNYQGFSPHSEVLKKGSQPYGARQLEGDIQIDHDVEIVVRDGARLYVDIYRPPGSENQKVPAVLSWSPYGKKYSSKEMLPMVKWTVGIDLEKDLSGLEKFEGVDPAIWVPRGYAVVSVDARGSGNSDGFVEVMGTQEAEDGYDVIEALAKMDWCNGNVGMAGNSYLAIVQWFIAAQQPPSLKAIAPWEGCGDIFREQFVRGGVFNISNFDLITRYIIQGNHGVEDFAEMYRRSAGVANPYWEDKRPDMKAIKVPIYVTASDSCSIHTMGSLRGYMEVDNPNKWLRWSAYQEWFDLYSVPENNVELLTFMDRYLKEIDNGWEKTPRVRVSYLKFGDEAPVENVPESDFPIPRTDYRQLYLASNNTLSDTLRTDEGVAVYNSEDREAFVGFKYTFTKTTRLFGMPKAHLFVSSPDSRDLVLYLLLRKLDRNGVPQVSLNIPLNRAPVNSIADMAPEDRTSSTLHLGSLGILRASHRAIDRSRSMHEQFPFHPHQKTELIEPGKIVELEIGIWNLGWEIEEGESIQLRVGGNDPQFLEYKTGAPDPPKILPGNKGNHKIHFGGAYPSRVILPFV
jgi:predicted acyl esterase